MAMAVKKTAVRDLKKALKDLIIKHSSKFYFMEERKNNQGQQQQGGDMGTSENSNDMVNPVSSGGGKAENSDNDTATAQTRNATDRAGAALSSKTNITGSDFDGQVGR
jgi:hypothetical protein